MAIDGVVEARGMAARPDDVQIRLRYVALAVPAVALLGGAVATVLEPRLGLFATALVLGWTQLAGP